MPDWRHPIPMRWVFRSMATYFLIKKRRDLP